MHMSVLVGLLSVEYDAEESPVTDEEERPLSQEELRKRIIRGVSGRQSANPTHKLRHVQFFTVFC